VVKRTFWTALLAGTSLALSGIACSPRGESQQAKPAQLPAEAPRKLRVLVLEGSPHNRGLIHGRAMKDQIQEVVRLWKTALTDVFKMDADAFIRRFVRQTDFVAAIKKWTPDLLDEIHGLAEGAGIDFDTMLTLQLPDECFINGEAVAADRCSSLGFGKSGGRPACVAQNMDVPSFADGFQLVLHIKHEGSDLEAFVLTQVGCIGLNGMNNRAMGVCTNALWQLSSSRDGLPVACVVRGVLQRRTEKDAIAFFHTIKHASGQNYVLGGPEHAYSFECSASRVERFMPQGKEDLVWHTNHPLVNNDYTAQYRALRKNSTDLAKREANTRTRLACLEKRLTKGSAARDVELVKAILASRDSAEYPVSVPKRDKNAAFTFASTIMVLAREPVFYVAPGPPEITAYQELSFTRPSR
jgi:predicted choloylglycine hydrolase